MAEESRDLLLRQFETAWMLCSYHLEGLSTEECLWRPAPRGLHVWREPDGNWRADWPEHEGYSLGPASIAWLTWHLGFWWSMALDHAFGAATLTREAIRWPGSAEGVRAWIGELRARWEARITALTEAELRTPRLTQWPLAERPFGDVVAWANVELSKNAAEIGYARFLYAVRETGG